MKRVLIPGVILCGADVAQAVDDKNMYMHVFEEMTVYPCTRKRQHALHQ